jgi:DNA-binding beta-propeller fold protein YncE
MNVMRCSGRSPATLVVALLAMSLAWLAAAPSAMGQTCAPGGTSSATPVVSAPLRSYRDYFSAPGRLAVDRLGAVYATDPESGGVYVRDRYGRLTGIEPGFATPLAIAVDAQSRIYVGEVRTGTVTVFDAQWRRLWALGSGDGEFQLPNDIAIDSTTGQIYVADSAAHEVKVYTRDGALKSVIGGYGAAAGRFDFPAAVHVSRFGEVFVADQNHGRVQVFNLDGQFLRCFGGDGSAFRFVRIQGLAGDSSGRLYVADSFQGEVQIFDGQGTQLGTVGTFGSLPGQLRTPVGVAVDPFGRLFVASANTGKVEVFGVGTYTDPHLVAAVVSIEPKTLFRPATRRRRSMTAHIEIRDASPTAIDAATITANAVPAMAPSVVIGEANRNAIADLTMRFDAASLLATLPDGDAVVVVSGRFKDGTAFEGYDSVRVIQRPDDDDDGLNAGDGNDEGRRGAHGRRPESVESSGADR